MERDCDCDPADHLKHKAFLFWSFIEDLVAYRFDTDTNLDYKNCKYYHEFIYRRNIDRHKLVELKVENSCDFSVSSTQILCKNCPFRLCFASYTCQMESEWHAELRQIFDVNVFENPTLITMHNPKPSLLLFKHMAVL